MESSATNLQWLDHAASCTSLDLLEGAVKERADGVAIEYFDARITYGELDALSNSFANALIEGGFLRGDRLMVFMQNTPHFVVAVFAAWKAGGSIVPVNPMNRAREVGLLLEDSEPSAILVSEELNATVLSEPELDRLRPKQVYVANPMDFQTINDARAFSRDGMDSDQVMPEFIGDTTRPEIERPRPEDTAYIVYTSGTTGKPKGVVLQHKNVSAGIAISVKTFSIGPDSRILALAPLFHVSGLLQHIGTAVGAACRLVLIYRFHPEIAVETIRDRAITNIAGASTAFVAMMDMPGFSRMDMNSVRVVATGGAPTAPTLLKRMEEYFGVKPMNGFGLTETAISTHLTPAGESIPVNEATGALSVGPPNIGVISWISGKDGKPAPAGVEGEIVVSGPTVSPGYWQKPEATREMFTDKGFLTGDIGVCDEQGWYYIVDRKKDMISASGFKVWPREVEDVLYSHPAVREAAVVGVPDDYRGETVKAVVSLRNGEATTSQDLSEFCKVKLAAYKRPRQIEIVQELPKTISGKILRRELRKAKQ